MRSSVLLLRKSLNRETSTYPVPQASVKALSHPSGSSNELQVIGSRKAGLPDWLYEARHTSGSREHDPFLIIQLHIVKKGPKYYTWHWPKILNYNEGNPPKKRAGERHTQDQMTAALQLRAWVHTDAARRDGNNHTLSSDGNAVLLCVTRAK